MPKAKNKEEVLKQKGLPVGAVKCPNVVCAPKPTSPPEDGPTCDNSTEEDSSRLRGLGAFRECCELWKCAYDDGSYYTHFGKGLIKGPRVRVG
jgi:hypothetical protein